MADTAFEAFKRRLRQRHAQGVRSTSADYHPIQPTSMSGILGTLESSALWKLEPSDCPSLVPISQELRPSTAAERWQQRSNRFAGSPLFCSPTTAHDEATVIPRRPPLPLRLLLAAWDEGAQSTATPPDQQRPWRSTLLNPQWSNYMVRDALHMD